jgi:hypothetical protein
MSLAVAAVGERVDDELVARFAAGQQQRRSISPPSCGRLSEMFPTRFRRLRRNQPLLLFQGASAGAEALTRERGKGGRGPAGLMRMRCFELAPGGRSATVGTHGWLRKAYIARQMQSMTSDSWPVAEGIHDRSRTKR